jgi:arginase
MKSHSRRHSDNSKKKITTAKSVKFMKPTKSSILIIQNSRGQAHRGVELSKTDIHKIVTHRTLYQIYDKSHFTNCYDSMLQLGEFCFKHPEFKLFIGGDHFTSFGTVLSSLMQYGNEFRLVWIDAHTDIHSFESSHTKNLHGMVVRMLMTHTFADIPRLLPDQLFYVGLRSVERAEMDFVKQHHIRHITAREFNVNPRKAMDTIIQFTQYRPLHISLDVDSLDPVYMPSTGTPVSNGLLLADLLELLRDIRRGSISVYADIMEYNPEIGSHKERKISIETIRRCIDVLIN